MPRRMSLGRTSRPSEYRTPRRRVKAYLRPASVDSGTEVAKSGTTVVPLVPPVRRSATSPSYTIDSIGP